jgi:hypothetical protein
VEIKSLEDLRQWHADRVAFFSHGGLPWGAMAHESEQAVKVLDQHIKEEQHV